MESNEAIWTLFLESRDRTDLPEQVTRDIGGAAKRLFPDRYRRYFEHRFAEAHPEEWREKLRRRYRQWADANKPTRRIYQRRYQGQMSADRREEFMERDRARQRVRYARLHPNVEPKRPPMTPEERKESNREAVRRYRAKGSRKSGSTDPIVAS